jgi:PhnB protein
VTNAAFVASGDILDCCRAGDDLIEPSTTTGNRFEQRRANGRLMHTSIRIGDSMVMLVDDMPEHGALGPKSLKSSPVLIHLYVEDADTFAAQAVQAGAKTTMPVTEMFWGDRYGQIEDPFGHRWSIATRVRDVAPAEMEKAMQKTCCAEIPS